MSSFHGGRGGGRGSSSAGPPPPGHALADPPPPGHALADDNETQLFYLIQQAIHDLMQAGLIQNGAPGNSEAEGEDSQRSENSENLTTVQHHDGHFKFDVHTHKRMLLDSHLGIYLVPPTNIS